MSLWDYIPLPPYEDGIPSFKLGLEEIVYLQQKQVILGDCVKGTWKINAACLNMSFRKKVEEASSGRASAESTNFFETIVPIDASTLPPITVPESTLSIPALLYIGWTEVAAEEIFDCWKDKSKPRKNCDDRDPSLIDYAISRVHARRDSFTPGMLEKLNARKEMIILGLSTPFQNEILDRDNNHPGGYVNTMDLHDWIIDKMGKRYRVLVIHLRYLKNYAATGVQAERRITDETLQEDSIRFLFRKKELPENKFLKKHVNTGKLLKRLIKFLIPLPFISIAMKSDPIISSLLISEPPSKKRYRKEIQIMYKGMILQRKKGVPTEANIIQDSASIRIDRRTKVKTLWKIFQSSGQDNGVGRKIVKTRRPG